MCDGVDNCGDFSDEAAEGSSKCREGESFELSCDSVFRDSGTCDEKTLLRQAEMSRLRQANISG